MRMAGRPGPGPRAGARSRLDLRVDLREGDAAVEAARTWRGRRTGRGAGTGPVRPGDRHAGERRVRALRDFQLRTAGTAFAAQSGVLGERGVFWLRDGGGTLRQRLP